MLQAEHLDEGTLHAFLDGELDSDQMAEVEHHLADCAECRRGLDQARAMLAESDDLIERLDPPPYVVLPEGGSMGGGRFGEPVVLMPPEPEIPRPSRPFAPPAVGRRWRLAGLAAGLVLLLGVGYLLNQGGDGARDVRLAQSEAPEAVSGIEGAGEMASPEGFADAARDPGPRDDGTTPPQTDSPAAADPQALAANAARPPADADAGDDGVDTIVAEAEQLAVQDEPVRTGAPPAAARRPPPVQQPAPQPRRQEAARQPAEQPAAAAARAEQAVEERTRAALENEAAAARAAAAPPAAPPDPMSALERRAGVYSRIGLDEAQRMLGGPVHVIADMRPQFVGLAPSENVPGADPGRPLVRVVYLDQAQRLIMLDQQRQSGDLPESTGNRIVMARGGVRLWLHGAVPAETLRALAGRVR